MKKENGSLEELILSEIEREAESIEKEVDASNTPEMSEELKNRIQVELHKKIDAYEEERLYSQLSERDREALRLGWELQRKREEESGAESTETAVESTEETEKKTVRYRKKCKKVYIGIAIAVVMLLALGMIGVGEARRGLRKITSDVGDREVVKVNSEREDNENKVISEESEEEAYDKVGEAFGVEPVRIKIHSKDLEFQSIDIDTGLQIAELYYSYQGEKVMYVISTSNVDSSLGIDVEDSMTDHYYIDEKGEQIEIKEYTTPQSRTKRYSASFSYNNMEYFLVGTMDKAEFEKIVEKLYFFN